MLRYKLKVENYYSNPRALQNAYLATNHFDVELVNVSHLFSEEDVLKVKKARGKTKRKMIFSQLNALDVYYLINNRPIDEDYIEQLNELEKQDAFLVDLYLKVDAEEIEKTDLNLTKMKRLYFEKTLAERELNLSNIVEEILLEFKLDIRYYSKDVKAKLQKIYDKYSYCNKPSEAYKAKAGDILNYFEGKYIEPKKRCSKRGYETYYVLTSKKYSFSRDLKLLN